ncbi:uncharacterized protein ASCRUDRAFT_105796 [Ascoidea rubescens DSM 1968]|uniref:Uncharacterized protein n=1 Tax=Ascoidea rubescens DSM 1968 TaxID=1344418 RepID=A0A1D2VSA4_9ASCO|nr:hypothetical protein ASCRUDRAFT_105796 [Ascoidea rubescens DSM 1968]ODV64502.1 hypothetical protein ASCRUDRAFT_105796 [Ascoidea rubescens DSM 1968]
MIPTIPATHKIPNLRYLVYHLSSFAQSGSLLLFSSFRSFSFSSFGGELSPQFFPVWLFLFSKFQSPYPLRFASSAENIPLRFLLYIHLHVYTYKRTII